MKKHNIISKFLRFTKILAIQFSIFSSLMLFAACDDLFSLKTRKELDIELLAFPPKLSVHAKLDGEMGIFDIRLMEGVSLAEYNPENFNKEIIRNGEIRLYEDGNLFLSISGPFDMSAAITGFGEGWKLGKNGYRFIKEGLTTHSGSVYRLEVEVEGYPKATSSSVMPATPVVSAKLDSSVYVTKSNVKQINSVGYMLYHMGNWQEISSERYWPFSVSINVQDVNNCVALDIFKIERIFVNSLYSGLRGYNWGIGGSDVAILLENGMTRELIKNENVDLYLFPMLITNNFTFSGKYLTRNFYAAVDEIPNHPNDDDSHFESDPDFEKMTTYHSLYLRFKNITPATYRYYQGFSSQYAQTIFNEQPAIATGNIEGAYGLFSVDNTIGIPLLEWETYEYWEKKE